MIVCEFVVPGYIQPKQRTMGRNFFTPTATRQAEREVATLAKAAMKGKPPYLGFVGLQITVVSEVPKSWTGKKKRMALAREIFPTHADLDNVTKLLSDAMNKIVFEDDRFVSELIVTRYYGAVERAEIKVYTLVPHVNS